MAYLTLDYIYGIYVVLILNLQAIIILFLMIYPPTLFFLTMYMKNVRTLTH